RLVRSRHRLLQTLEHRVEGDPLLALQLAERRDHLGVQACVPFSSAAQSTTVRADPICRCPRRRTTPLTSTSIARSSEATRVPTWTDEPSTGSTVLTSTCRPTTPSAPADQPPIHERWARAPPSGSCTTPRHNEYSRHLARWIARAWRALTRAPRPCDDRAPRTDARSGVPYLREERRWPTGWWYGPIGTPTTGWRRPGPSCPCGPRSARVSRPRS